MKIILAGLMPLPCGSAGASRLMNFAYALVHAGHECEVIGWDWVSPENGAALQLDSQRFAYRGLQVYVLKSSLSPRLRGLVSKLPFVMAKGFLMRKLARRTRQAAGSEEACVLLYDQDLRLTTPVLRQRRRRRPIVIQQYGERQVPADFRGGICNPFYWEQSRHIAVAPDMTDGSIVVSEA